MMQVSFGLTAPRFQEFSFFWGKRQKNLLILLPMGFTSSDCVNFLFRLYSFLGVVSLSRINLDNRALLVSSVDLLKTKFTISFVFEQALTAEFTISNTVYPEVQKHLQAENKK